MIWPKDVFTRFEIARLLGARSLQIALGAPLLIENADKTPIELAKMEFESGIIPITVKRKMPDGTQSVINSKVALVNWLEKHNGKI